MKSTITVFIFLIASCNLFSQDIQKLQSAFSQSYVFESDKNYVDAIEVIVNVHNDKNYETSMRLGWLYYQNKKYPESVNIYSKAIELKPNSIEAKLGLANAHSAQYNWDAVVNVYNDILKIDPNQVTVNYRLGLIYYNRENFIQAKKYFDVYLNLYPFEFDALSISAWNNLKLGKKDVAKDLFNKALLLYPKNTDSLEGLKQCK